MVGILGLWVAIPWAQASVLELPGARVFIEQMTAKHRFNGAELRGLFRGLEIQKKVLAAIKQPAEAKPWSQYREIFVTQNRIDAGKQFLAQHHRLLNQVEAEFGVPAAIVTAIIGVETRYGQHRGAHPAMASLATLAFDYPKRSAFFKRELEEFLLLSREENLDPLAIKGSYAAAMGVPQFISSSYRAYALDFDGDGRRDLWESPADIFASVANYFRRHGWIPGGAVVHRVSTQGAAYQDLLEHGLKPSLSRRQLRAAGVQVAVDGNPDAKFTLLELQAKEGPEIWVAEHNFYVITRYNHSALYAMAVYQLSQAIAR